MPDSSAPDEPIGVVQAMQRVMELVTVVRKDQVNTTPGQGGYKFRGIDAVVNALGPAMRQVGVVVLPDHLIDVHQKEITVGQKQSRMIHSVVRVQYRIFGPAGDYLPGESVGEAFDSGDKSMAKAMSVSLRTFLLQAFMLPTDEPDADETSYELSTASRPEGEPESWGMPYPTRGRRGMQQGDGERQALPASKPTERARGAQAKAQRDDDPWASNPLTDEGGKVLEHLLITDDPEYVRTLWREIRVAGKPQTVTLDVIGAEQARAIGMAGDLDLLEVASKVGAHLADNGISVAEHVRAEAAPDPSPMGSGDADAARDAADTVRGDPARVGELRRAARGQNGGHHA